jgi:hypothetical protein
MSSVLVEIHEESISSIGMRYQEAHQKVYVCREKRPAFRALEACDFGEK